MGNNNTNEKNPPKNKQKLNKETKEKEKEKKIHKDEEEEDDYIRCNSVCERFNPDDAFKSNNNESTLNKTNDDNNPFDIIKKHETSNLIGGNINTEKNLKIDKQKKYSEKIKKINEQMHQSYRKKRECYNTSKNIINIKKGENESPKNKEINKELLNNDNKNDTKKKTLKTFNTEALFQQSSRNFYPKNNINIDINKKNEDTDNIKKNLNDFIKRKYLPKILNNNNENNIDNDNINSNLNINNNNINTNNNNINTNNSGINTNNNNHINTNINSNLNLNTNNGNNINNLNNEIGNININEIIQQNQNNKPINQEDYEENELKFNSHLNLNIENTNNIITPNYFSLFEDINIFNSILIMMNNISFLNDYFQIGKTRNVINNCNNYNQYCLSGILYYINKYLWNYKEKLLISENYLLKKYKDFIDCYIQTNCENQNSSTYCYDINNLGIIMEFIYTKINKELTSEKLQRGMTSYNYYGNDPFSIYKSDFEKNNKSIISDYFMGAYVNQKFCGNCQSKSQRFGLNINNIIQYNYRTFSNINLDINEIYNYYFKKNDLNFNNVYANNISLNNNNNYNSINLYECFYYVFGKKNKKYQSYCNNCYTFTIKYEYDFIYMLPNILSIVLSNNDNFNFVLHDELDLKQYSKHWEKDGIYSIISILCQTIYNKKYICYCINPNNGAWYSYSDGKINEVEKMDINAIPLIVIYQLKNTIKFNYKNIIRDDSNKICLNIKFSNGTTSKLIVTKNSLIKNIIETIKIYSNLGDAQIKLLINGRGAEGEQIISNLTKKGQNEIDVTAYLF